MVQHYTAVKSTDDVDETEVNSRLTELSDAIDDVLDGTLAQSSPDIIDFTNAVHDHEDAAGGGLLTLAAFNSGGADANQAITADGSGGASLISQVLSFLGLTDTPDSFSGLADKLLRVNASANAVEGFNSDPQEHTAYTLSNYTTTSTSFVDVDATYFSLDIDTAGEDLIIVFSATCYNTTSPNLVYFDFDVDGSRVGSDDGIVTAQFTTAVIRPVCIFRRVSVSAGSHTVKLQWKVNGNTGIMHTWGGTGFNLGVHPQLFVMKAA